jgi:hypothetical protein
VTTSRAEPPRSAEQRKRDVLARLTAPVADCWVATGDAYLVPLTLAWFGDRILLATSRDSRTARSLARDGRARVALGHTRDVVMIDAVLDETIPVAQAGAAGEAYAAQSDWDPRTAGDSYVFLALRPERIQAWREVGEIAGRTVMRDGAWLV